MKHLRSWIVALWLGWVVSCLLLLVFWLQAHSARAQAVLNERRLAMSAHLDQLQESFRSLEQLPRLLVTTVAGEARRDLLTAPRLEQLKVQASPFYQLGWVTPDSDGELPAWAAALARRRTSGAGLTVIRPLPPGLQAGRVDLKQAPDTPAQYLLYAQRVGDRIVVCRADLDYIFGPWLKRRIASFGLEGQATAALSERSPWEPLSNPAPEEVSRLGVLRSFQPVPEWRWELPTFFGDSEQPFRSVEVVLDNQPALTHLTRSYYRGLLLGLAAMGAFAASLVLAVRSLRKEAEYSEARSRFTAMVGHEFRTPLTAIEMYLEILRTGMVEDPDKIANYHQILQKETNRLRSLVENILTLATLDREGGEELSKEPIHLHPLLEEVAGEHDEVSLDLQAPRDHLVANPVALRGVFHNLLDNAAKYGGSEPASVSTHQRGDSLRVEVADRGTGVAANQRTKIFEPYHRSSRDKPGVGLGLALAKEMVERHGGRIWVEDRPGGGALFCVELPLEERP